jgi:hypothetical protein
MSPTCKILRKAPSYRCHSTKLSNYYCCFALRKRRRERERKENGHLPEVAALTWETEMTSVSPWREVAFGVNLRFSRSSCWQATTWYRRTWDIMPCWSQSLIWNRGSSAQVGGRSFWIQPLFSPPLHVLPLSPPRLWEEGFRLGLCQGPGRGV